MHAISSHCGNRPTNKHPHTHKHTHKPIDMTDYNTQRCSFASTQRNKDEAKTVRYVLLLPLCRSNSLLPNLSNPSSLAGTELPRPIPRPRRDEPLRRRASLKNSGLSLNTQTHNAGTSSAGIMSHYYVCVSVSVLTAIFPGKPGLAIFIEAKSDGSGGDNWSYRTCKAPIKSSPSTNQHPMFYMPESSSWCCPTSSIKALKENISQYSSK